MTNIANIIGRVMMTAVKLPRSQKDKLELLKTYSEIEFRKGDQAYVLDCLVNDRKIDVA